MALTTAEVTRLRAELGYNVLGIGAEPYIGITSIFDAVIQPYVLAGASTTSTTSVTAATTPTPSALTLASATGFAAGETVVVDVDARQEVVTVQSITGAVITVLLSRAHAGTYPVTVEGGETIVREYLRKLRLLSNPGGTYETMAERGGVKKVDEIEFFGSEVGSSSLRDVDRLQRKYRNELASILGVPNLRDGGASSVSPY